MSELPGPLRDTISVGDGDAATHGPIKGPRTQPPPRRRYLPRLGVEIYVKEGRSDEADVSDGPRLPVAMLPLAFVISPPRL